jgi:hypothetical protein
LAFEITDKQAVMQHNFEGTIGLVTEVSDAPKTVLRWQPCSFRLRRTADLTRRRSPSGESRD